MFKDITATDVRRINVNKLGLEVAGAIKYVLSVYAVL
jgi:hypothetical protein